MTTIHAINHELLQPERPASSSKPHGSESGRCAMMIVDGHEPCKKRRWSAAMPQPNDFYDAHSATAECAH
jgi:hypothetical protein